MRTRRVRSGTGCKEAAFANANATIVSTNARSTFVSSRRHYVRYASSGPVKKTMAVPKMLTFQEAAGNLIIAGSVTAALYFVLRPTATSLVEAVGRDVESSAKKPAAAGAQVTTVVDPKNEDKDTSEMALEGGEGGGVLGLRSLDRRFVIGNGKESALAGGSSISAAAAAPPPAATEFLELGEIGESRVTEELAWAAGVLCELDSLSGVVIYGTDGSMLYSEGELICDDERVLNEACRVVQRVSENSREEVIDVLGNEIFPFLKNTVRSVALLPLGEDGAVLVLASKDNGFFDIMERRVASAVATRLAAFVGRKTSIESEDDVQ